MPNVQCKFFDRDGNPIGRGCLTAYNNRTCPFVHPGQPQWATASPADHLYDPNRRRAPYDDGRREHRDQHHYRRDSRGSRDFTHDSPDGRRDARDSRPHDRGYDDRRDTHGHQRRASASHAPIDRPGRRSPALPPPPDSAPAAPSSWASSDAPAVGSGWGAAAAGPWGWGAESSTSKAPAPWESAPTAPKDTAADNTANRTASTGAATATPAEGAPGPREQATGKGAGHWDPVKPASWSTVDAGNAASDPNAMDVDTNPPAEPNPQTLPPPDSPPPPRPIPLNNPAPPLPRIRTSVTPAPGLGQSPTTALTPRHRVFSESSLRRPSASGTSTPTIGSFRGPSSYDGPSGASRLYTDTIKALRNLAIAEVVYQRAAKINDQHRRMQNGPVYANATLVAREILNEKREEWGTKMHSLKRKRDEKMAALLALPDLAEKLNAKVTRPAETKAAIMAYSQELQSWFEDIQLHKRLLLEEKEIAERRSGAPASQPPPQPFAAAADADAAETRSPSRESSPDPDTQLPLLLAKETWTWQDMLDAAALLHKAVEKTLETVSFELYTRTPEINRDHIEAAINAEMDQEEAMPEIAMPDIYTDEIAQASASVNAMGAEVQEQATDIGELLSKINSLEQEIKELREECIEMEAVIEEAEAQFALFEESAQQDAEQIEALTARLQTLHVQKELAAKAPPPPPPPQQPIDISQIIPLLRPGVTGIVKQQLEPILQALLEKCRQNQSSLLAELEQLIQPLNEDTDKLLNFQP